MAGVQIDGVNNKIDFDDDLDTSISANTDDTLVIEAGGNTLATFTATTLTINDGTTITTADNTDTLTLKSTDADANSGPNLKLARDSGSPADGDVIGQIIFTADDDAGNATDFFTMSGNIRDASNGNEEVQMVFYGQRNGAVVNYLEFDDDHVVFNEGSADIDFRIESDSAANMFNLQAAHANNSAGTIGFNSTNSDGNFIEAINPQGGAYAAKFDSSASSGAVYLLSIKFSGQAPDDNNSYMINGRDSSTGRFAVYADGDVVNHDNSYGSISDERIKSEIVDANSQWDDIKALKIRNYKKNEDIAEYGDKAWVQLGVIAQELEAAGMDKCVKQEVLYTADDQDVAINKTAKEGDIKEYKTVKYSILYMKAIKALQEAQTRIETLETKVAALEG